MLGITVYQVYGLTETTAIVTMDKQGKVEAGRVGMTINGCEMKLSDDNELLCRGPNIFAGYWNRPDETANAIRDGWFYSGDQAEVDAHGNWKIIGRVGNLLVPESGHNVAPEPIEQKLMEALDTVEQCVVVGHGKPFLTAIVTGEVEQAQVDAAMEAVNNVLPHYRRIRKIHCSNELFTIENGLLTANQKLKRKAIIQHYEHAIRDMYAA
jgi:long-chain acyl-CoA synthetase